jgi:hypothetical protein
VILAGLIAATLLNTLVLPAACLRFGPARVPEQDLAAAEPPEVPQPRQEPAAPAVPEPAGPAEHPAG